MKCVELSCDTPAAEVVKVKSEVVAYVCPTHAANVRRVVKTYHAVKVRGRLIKEANLVMEAA